jgi:hypothetical protein
MKIILLIKAAAAFYTPGIIMKDYRIGDILPVEVSAIDSLITHVPYDYFLDAQICK